MLEKRDACAVCGKKYVRQLIWGKVKRGFLKAAAEAAEVRRRHLAALAAEALAEARPMTVTKAVLVGGRLLSTRLFRTAGDQGEVEDMWEAFDQRRLDDDDRRARRLEAARQTERSGRHDPECTFTPRVHSLDAEAAAFPHLRRASERFKAYNFNQQLEDSVGHVDFKRALGTKDDEKQLPSFADKGRLHEF
jgi:hypothetical protein